MATIDKTGITGKTLTQYLEDVRARYRAIDASWNLDPSSPDGQAISIWSELFANLDEVAQYAYMSRDPAAAQGQALNDIADYAGLERKLGTYSTALVEVYGAGGTVIPAGSRIRNVDTKSLWATDSSVTISSVAGVTNTVQVTAVERGSVSAGVGELTQIATPVAGWQRVTNPDAAALGRADETDTEFRLRRNRSVANPGGAQVDSIYAAVFGVDGVNQVKIYENDDSVPDSNGLRDHSIAIFVQGGDISSLRSAIAAKKNPGCGMNRDNGIPNEVSGRADTPLGNPVDITFFRPENVTIYVNVTVMTSQLSELDKVRIKDAIVKYSVEGFNETDGFVRRGYQIGERVSSGRLYTPVNDYIGEQGFVESITVGASAGSLSGAVPIAFNQIGVIDQSTITVEYVE